METLVGAAKIAHQLRVLDALAEDSGLASSIYIQGSRPPIILGPGNSKPSSVLCGHLIHIKQTNKQTNRFKTFKVDSRLRGSYNLLVSRGPSWTVVQRFFWLICFQVRVC